jgi:hypothetical protein
MVAAITRCKVQLGTKGPEPHSPADGSKRLLAHRDPQSEEAATMDGIIYLVGLIVIIMFILSAIGLR